MQICIKTLGEGAMVLSGDEMIIDFKDGKLMVQLPKFTRFYFDVVTSKVPNGKSYHAFREEIEEKIPTFIEINPAKESNND